MKRLLIIINKQKIFLDKVKRTGSNLKKRANFTRIVFKLVFNLSSVGVTNSNSYQRSSTAKEYGSCISCAICRERKEYYLFIVFPYYKSQKILVKRN